MDNRTTKYLFPDGFLWGAATSAFQIEGSPLADGAGPTNWHIFTHLPGTTVNGDTGDIAADHYTRYVQDVQIMRRLGLTAYRFSMNWARVMPDGRGKINRAGIDFYSRLIDTLLANGVDPCATLHHWDLPAALDEEGGWMNRDSAEWFADYARHMFREFGDRVSMWATINEPWVIEHAGYVTGVHAPGRKNVSEAAKVSHNLLRAHGAAVRVAREESVRKIGIVVNIEPKTSASPSDDDEAATVRADVYMNRQYIEPVLTGRYPDGLDALYAGSHGRVFDDDLALISTPVDFIGLNYYTRAVVEHDGSVIPDTARAVRQSGLHTETGWEVHPESLTSTLLWIKERYGDMPIYITENGAAFPDPPHVEGALLEDPLRVEYFRSHLKAAHAAIAQGVDLRGYFAWSLLDNLEWAAGFTKRFGLIHVDFETQKRTWKASAEFYREVIRTNGAVLDG